jgi:hypothetical protein
MADISLVVEVLGEESLDRAMTATNKLERGINKLSKSFQQGKLTESQLRTGLNQLAKSSATVGRTYQNNLKITKRYEGQILRTARSLDVLERETIGADAAQKRYNVTLANGDRAVNQFGVQASRSQVKMKRFGSVGLQQVGYQVQDFAVQLQGGTNAAVAFGQQGSQLLGIFGAGGALAGAALAITTAFIAPLLDARKAAKGLGDTMEGLSGAISSTKTAIDVHKMSVIELVDKYGLLGNTAKAAFAEIARSEAVAGAKEAKESPYIDKLKGDVQGYINALVRLEVAKKSLDDVLENGEGFAQFGAVALTLESASEEVDAATEVVERFKESFGGLIGLDARNLVKQLNDFTNATGIQDLASEAADVFNILNSLPEAIKNSESPAAKLLKFFQRITPELAEAARLSSNLEVTLSNGDTWFDAITRGATSLAEYLRELFPFLFGEGEDDKRGTGPRPKPNPFFDGPPITKPKKGSSTKDPLEELKKRLNLQEKLLGQTETESQLIKALGVDYEKYGETTLNVLRNQIDEIRRVNDEIAQQEQILDSIGSASDDFFNSLVDGTITVKDAFKDMARSILADLWDIFVTKQITGFIVEAISGAMGAPTASAPTSSPTPMARPTRFASGGIVGSPTLFPMADGMGLMGEAGPEAIMPLKRGKDGKLGVAGGGGDTIVVNQSFNFSANGDESVKKLIAQAAPSIANLTKNEILKDRRRGGAMKATFG